MELTEYRCGNCQESFHAGPNPRACPFCKAENLTHIIKESAPVIEKGVETVTSKRRARMDNA